MRSGKEAIPKLNKEIVGHLIKAGDLLTEDTDLYGSVFDTLPALTPEQQEKLLNEIALLQGKGPSDEHVPEAVEYFSYHRSASMLCIFLEVAGLQPLQVINILEGLQTQETLA